MEQVPDHPAIRAMERTGYPPRAGTKKRKEEAEDGEGLHRDPPRLP